MQYKNKYRIESARLKNWDYSSDGCYFITVCTHNREHFFGTINNHKMILSDIGKTAEQFWGEIPDHFPMVRLDEFVIMPNHVHGIVVIDKSITANNMEFKKNGGPGVGATIIVETPNLGVSTECKHRQPGNFDVSTDWKPGTIGVVINQYKRICTIQSRFHDHIIRINDELIRIREYIMNNPMNWDNDDLQSPNDNLVERQGI